jgi:two-component system, LytTR family, response regulator
MKTKILVIDNEAPIRKAFVKILLHFCDDSYEIFEAESVKTGVQAFNTLSPHILFLDIELDDGTGFDLLNAVEIGRTQLVFTTAHNQYAIRAFEYSALNYLLKPISPSALQKALQKARENIQQTDVSAQLQVLLGAMQKTDNHQQKLVLKDVNGIYFVKTDDILFCEADGPYTKFTLSNADPIIVSKNLKEYEDLLEPYLFARCHHSYLVNLKKITSLDKTDGHTLILENRYRIPVSVRKKEEILGLLSKIFIQ